MKAVAFLVLLASVGSANAQSLPGGFTCEQVRKLTRIERRVLIIRLGLTDDQVEQIKAYCKIR